MAKYITLQELKGIKIDTCVRVLLNDINAKGTIDGRYFSSWWFDYEHRQEEKRAMNDIMFGLALNFAKVHGTWFNNGAEAQVNLSEVASYIAKKLNTWSFEIVRWLKGMKYSGYGIDVNDALGLDAMFIKK